MKRKKDNIGTKRKLRQPFSHFFFFHSIASVPLLMVNENKKKKVIATAQCIGFFDAGPVNDNERLFVVCFRSCL